MAAVEMPGSPRATPAGGRVENDESRQPLAGIRVLELRCGVAGCYAAKLLADFGAEVIKVEPAGSGDPLRTTGPFVQDAAGRDVSALFLHLNTNKRSITLDVETPDGAAIFRDLASSADVVLESTVPGDLDQLGIGFEALLERRPGLVLVSVTPFGQTGPYARYRGDDAVIYAMGGMYAQGLLGRPPLKMAGYHVQYHAGTLTATAILGALHSEAVDPGGVHVDVSLLEVQSGAIDARRPMLVSFQYNHKTLKRRERAEFSTIPSAIYPAKDGHVQIMTIPAHVQRMVDTLDSPDLRTLLLDPGQLPADSSSKDLIDAFLMPWLLERTRYHAMTDAQRHKWAVTSMNTPGDVLDDPHFTERGSFIRLEGAPGLAHLRVPGPPIRMADGWQLRRVAPALGEDTDAICTSLLGMPAETVSGLRQRGIV
jgi:crotonobetainyl-CoA:carnitine CoA-transferase CaiB-like acyl-CoA transferase